MKQAAEQLRTYSPSEIMFWTLSFGIVLMSVSYVYFVQKAVWNAVARVQIQREIADLNSKLSDTEFSYINNVGAITLSSAKLLGFAQTDSKSITFVTKDSLASGSVGKNVAIR
jgi:hypothetical protein